MKKPIVVKMHLTAEKHALNLTLLRPEVVILEVPIDSERGFKSFDDIATFKVLKETNIIFKLEKAAVKGNLSIAISCHAYMGEEYEIDMPCLFMHRAKCYRVLMLIPGYDVPLKVHEGDYKLSLKVMWMEAKGEGEVYLKVCIRSRSRAD